MLMDVFYNTLPMKRKRRVHFHAFMADVHKRVHQIRKLKKFNDPVPPLALDLFNDAYVLCFDELQVTDIKDAMIIRRLFEELISHGCIIVTTSNRHPDDLYYNGIQRQSFIPAIELIKEKLVVHSLNSGVDYRKQEREQFKVSFHPLNSYTQGCINMIWKELTKGKVMQGNVHVRHLGRSLVVPESCERMARFSFHDLCGKPYGATDYLELCKYYDTVLLTDIPKLSVSNHNQVRRLITLLDTLYENKIKLIISADAPITKLFSADDDLMDNYGEDTVASDKNVMSTKGNDSAAAEELFAFQRTVSRLVEMQGKNWFGTEFEDVLKRAFAAMEQQK